MPEIATELDTKSRAVRAAAKAIGVGERWITKEHFARVFAAEIIAAIEDAAITLVDADHDAAVRDAALEEAASAVENIVRNHAAGGSGVRFLDVTSTIRALRSDGSR